MIVVFENTDLYSYAENTSRYRVPYSSIVAVVFIEETRDEISTKTKFECIVWLVLFENPWSIV